MFSLTHSLFQSGPKTIVDPCFHPDYSESKEYSVIYDSPCVSARKPQNPTTTFNHMGAGNFTQCQEVVKNIFNFTSCKYSQCSFNDVFQPPLQGTYGVKQHRYFQQRTIPGKLFCSKKCRTTIVVNFSSN